MQAWYSYALVTTSLAFFSVHHFMLNGSTQQQHSKRFFFSSRKRQRSSKSIAQERAVTTDIYTHTKRSEEKDEKKPHQNTKNRLTHEEVKNTRRTARGLKRFSSSAWICFFFIHCDGICEWVRVFLYRAVKAGEGTNRISEQATIQFQSKKQDDHSLSCWFNFFPVHNLAHMVRIISTILSFVWMCVCSLLVCVFFLFFVDVLRFCWCSCSRCLCVCVRTFFFHSSVCFNCNWCFYSIFAARVCMRVGHSDHN